jgi:ornithine--oxo-acid transaminase
MESVNNDVARLDPYERYVNTQWVRLFNVLGMNVHFANCLGSELFTEDWRRILDFQYRLLSSRCGAQSFQGSRHHQSGLDRSEPVMLQGHAPELAGELAQRLCAQAGGRLSKPFFALPQVKALKPSSSSRALTPGVSETAWLRRLIALSLTSIGG